MSVLGKLKPNFWDHEDVAAGPYRHLFNFRRIWIRAVLLTAGVTLIPLMVLTLFDYQVTQNAIKSEILLRMSRLTSNTWHNISFFISERKAALDFIGADNTFDELQDPERLGTILENLERGFGGIADLGVIDALGTQRAYAGPYELEGITYSKQAWYTEVLDRGVHVSDVFMGFRQIPHLTIAVKHEQPSGSFYVLRATLDTRQFNELLSNFHVSGVGDAFIINHQGTLQTPSRYHGRVLESIDLPTPEYSSDTKVIEGKTPDGKALMVGYAYIPHTPFVLMIVKAKSELMRTWYETRMDRLIFLGVSITIILIVILGVATYLVNSIHVADQKRVMILHQVEYANKMASIGRLGEGVAHEINNPLAIIHEKAGLIKDIFTLNREYGTEKKLMDLVDSIVSSVDRCATITRRLLNFARRSEVKFLPINLVEIIHEVLGFLGKEAEYRSIKISFEVNDPIPQLESDQGSLQQIFLNLLNNSFEAMNDGGHLKIQVRQEDKDFVSVIINDDGVGIPDEDLKRVFEPFFSAKGKKVGTGLGLSITYGLVQEIQGKISVRSKVGEGTTFIITLPTKMERKESQD